MAIEVARLLVVIQGDDSGLTKIEDSTEKAKKGVRNFTSDAEEALKHLRATAAGALAEISRSVYEHLTRPAIEAGKAWIETASDTGEQLDKVKVLLGKNAKDVDDWSKKTASSIGISRREALTFAGTFSNLFRSMQFSQDASASMSKGLVQLAADLASLSNASPTEALDAIRSAMVGESEPMRRFGVNMSELTLKNEALKQGLIKTTKEALSPAQKAAAAYGLIMQQTSLAQGNFSLTSQGLANQQRLLAAEFDNLKATLGAQLLPTALAMVRVGREWIAGWQALPQIVRDVMTVVAGLAAAIPAVVLGFRQVSIVGGLIRQTLAGLTPIFTGIATAVGVSAGELLLIIGAIAAAAAGLYLAWKNNFGGIRDFTDSVMKVVVSTAKTAMDWLSTNIPTALAYMALHLKGSLAAVSVMAKALGEMLVSVGGVIASAVSWIAEHWSAFMQFIMNVSPLGMLAKTFSLVFGTIRQSVGANLDAISTKLKDFLLLVLKMSPPGMIAQAIGLDKVIMKAWDAYKDASKGFSAEAVAAERSRIEAQIKGLQDSVGKMVGNFKLPAMPKLPGVPTPDFKGMNLPGLPGSEKDDKEGKRRADELRRRMAEITEDLMRMSLNRFDFERWQAQQAYQKDIALGVSKAIAQKELSATLRQIMLEEGREHQRVIDQMSEADGQAYEKQRKAFASIREHLEKATKKSNEIIQRFNEEQVKKWEQDQKAAAEVVAKAKEQEAAVSMKIVGALQDQASAFDAIGKRTDYYADSLAKLNLQNEQLTQEQQAAVQTYANAWRELDRIHERQKLISQTAQELQGVFANAFAAGLTNAKSFFSEIGKGIKQLIVKQISDALAGVAVKELMKLFGVKQNGLADSARSARNDILIASIALAASAEVLKEAAKEARKAAVQGAAVAAGTATGGPIGGAIAGLFAGFFADGGTVPPYHRAIVGERGPEMIQAGSTPISVTPNQGRAVSVTNHFYGDLKSDAPSKVSRELRRSLALGM